MFNAFLIFAYKLFKGRKGVFMLIKLFASEILMGNITLDEVPRGLRDGVREYLEDMGYDFGDDDTGNE